MSYGAGTMVINYGQGSAVSVIGGQLNALGQAASALAAGAAIAGVAVAAIVAVEGALVLRDLAKNVNVKSKSAKTSGVSFTSYRTALSAKAMPLFAKGLEARHIAFAEGGSLQFGGGSGRVAYTAFDNQGRVLFFVRETSDDLVELIVANEQVMPVVEAVVVETLIKLAEQTLLQQGFRMARRDEDHNWVFSRSVPGGISEEVRFTFGGGQVTAVAASRDSEGRLLTCNECPNMEPFLGYLPSSTRYAIDGKTVSPKPRGGGSTEQATREATHRDNQRKRGSEF